MKNEVMKLVEISGNILKVTSYNSSSGTLSDPFSKSVVTPTISSYNKEDINTSIINISIDGSVLTERAIILNDKSSNRPIASLTTSNIDTNSVSYNSDIEAFYDALTSAII